MGRIEANFGFGRSLAKRDVDDWLEELG